MHAATVVALGALLLALLAGLVAVMLWQEAKRPSRHLPSEYIIDDVVAFVMGEGVAGTEPDDVRRIIEWHVHYLQDRGRHKFDVVVGGTDEAVEFVVSGCLTQGKSFEPSVVRRVLEVQTGYLVEIGAVGEEVEQV